ncbi:MAG: antibiotic biosynthesis monooxygenase [Rhodobacterales bacterium]|nr:antibiotic biosynthesis monooxygenase [Rhodobacterales bacterium]
MSPSSPPPPLADTPEPPYYAVIFASTMTGDDPEGYAAMAQAMVDLAARQPGYLGLESARGPDGLGITVSYWTDPAAITAWKAQAEHQVAQRLGRDRWYGAFRLRVARVERAYGFDR